MRPFGLDSTIAKGKNVTMVARGAHEGEGQNNVVVYMDFVLVYCKGMST
jgi:hypothetical protein